jgi:hypothetical protein
LFTKRIRNTAAVVVAVTVAVTVVAAVAVAVVITRSALLS